jgi:hypothetical protein
MNFKIKALHSDSGFSWQRAMNMALASKLAYLDSATIASEAVKWGFQEAKFFKQNKTEGFVAWDSRCVVVSFRGTKELGDWLTDMNAFRADVAYGKVHQGFLGGFNDVHQDLQGLLKAADASDKTVWLTGHSLGGALSTIMAGEWLGKIPMHGVYTFGQPRVVNRSAQEYFRVPYKGRFFRFVNDDDVVPKVPALLQHVGEVIWFDSKGRLKESPPGVRADDFGPEALSEEEFEEFKEKIRSFRPQINREHEAVEEEPIEEYLDQAVADAPVTRGLFPSVRDHFMDNYLNRVWAKLQAEV